MSRSRTRTIHLPLPPPEGAGAGDGAGLSQLSGLSLWLRSATGLDGVLATTGSGSGFFTGAGSGFLGGSFVATGSGFLTGSGLGAGFSATALGAGAGGLESALTASLATPAGLAVAGLGAVPDAV